MNVNGLNSKFKFSIKCNYCSQILNGEDGARINSVMKLFIIPQNTSVLLK